MSAKVVTGNPEIDAYFTKRLSQKADAIEMAIPQQDGREFDECQVEVVAAVPADQDRAAAVEPRQRSLHHPPSGLVGWGALLPGPLVANQRDVRDVLMIDADAIARVVVIAFVEQQVLLPTRLDRWPFQHHGADGGVQHLGIRNIRSRDDRRQRQAMPLDQDGALYPVLGPIGGVGPDLDPPFRAFPMLPSAACHSQSTPLRSSQASMRSAQIASNTCRSDQRTKVRCTELSSGKEAGRWFHWHPVRSRKIIASSAARASMRRRPRGFGGSRAPRIGAIRSQSRSGISQSVGSGRCVCADAAIHCLSDREIGAGGKSPSSQEYRSVPAPTTFRPSRPRHTRPHDHFEIVSKEELRYLREKIQVTPEPEALDYLRR